jgi:23S rRNA (uracil747-C5)-methyltransferase
MTEQSNKQPAHGQPAHGQAANRRQANPGSDGCSYYSKGLCKSCTLLHLPYATQVAQKQSKLEALLGELGSIALLPMVSSTKDYGSRNKAKLAVGGTTAAPQLGFPNREGVITPVLDCPLHLPMLNELAAICLREISAQGISPYDVRRRSGELKYLLLRGSESTGELMLRVVLRSELQAERARDLCASLQKQIPELKVTSLNFQPHPKAIVEGEREEILSENRRLRDTLGAIPLLYSPQSFSQVTSNVAEKLYATAATWMRESNSRRLLDLYCGVGAFSLFAAKHLERGHGIELSSSAIGDAQEAAKLNSFTHLSFEALDVDAFLRKGASLRGTYDTVVVNPPRRGLSPATIAALKAMEPKTVIYSSCNAESLVRDLRVLSSTFSLSRVQPFDMFPMTEHFETLVELALKS